jgi:site-specific DNA recombinase
LRTGQVCAYSKLPEKLVKGVHEAIIPESLYYQVQDKLKGNKRVKQSKPKEEFPLKGIIKSPCCGRNLTAGWSTRRLKKYMYYRWFDPFNVNIPGTELDEKFEELLCHLSFTTEFVDDVVVLVSGKVKEILKSNENR